MAEFSVLFRKKNEDDSGSDVPSCSRRRLVFYENSSDDEQVKRYPSKSETKTLQKPSVNKISNLKSEYRHHGLPRCPVCREILESKVQKVFNMPASSDVYFPFLDTGEHEVGKMPTKVKICYPCYEHLLYQWREYNMLQIPHKKRKYHDRQGILIKSTNEFRKEIEKRSLNEISESAIENEVRGINRKLDEKKENELRKREEELLRRERELLFKEEQHRRNANTKHNKENLDNSLNSISSLTLQNDTQKKSLNQNETKIDDINFIMKDIHSQLERIELNSNASIEIAKQEIEKSIKTYTDRIEDQMHELRVENETVRKQVKRMRKDIADLIDNVAPGIEEHYEKKSSIKNKNTKFSIP
ncbi:trichohyalin [Hydra vulgaris]|uniref:trichohyalin n=1 Tax=Hydra vulgaris TaxID=6087 RepID=UPI001F5E7EB1|nr:trichohyalin [Hydra vulgaris]